MAAVAEPLGSAEPASPAAAVHTAQERIAHAIRVGHLHGDPLCDALEAMSVSLGAQLALHEATVERVTLPADPAALERLECSAATGADRRAMDLARAHNLRTLLVYGGALAGAVLLALGGNFAWGRSSANGAVAQTERRLAAAFEDGPDAAAAWVGLMEQNDLRAALANCKGSSVYADSAGRKVCAMPLYIEPLRRGG